MVVNTETEMPIPYSYQPKSGNFSDSSVTSSDSSNQLADASRLVKTNLFTAYLALSIH